MSECNLQVSRPWTDEIVAFYQRLHEVLEGGHPDLSPAERRWLRLFDEVARIFRQVPTDESYTLSFDALCKCVQKGKADNDKYVLMACTRKHIDHVRYRRRRRGRVVPLTDDHPDDRDHHAGVDARLDLEEALAKLRAVDPRGEMAVQMQLADDTYKKIADKLGVSERHAIRLTQDAKQRLRDLLTDYES